MNLQIQNDIFQKNFSQNQLDQEFLQYIVLIFLLNLVHLRELYMFFRSIRR